MIYDQTQQRSTIARDILTVLAAFAIGAAFIFYVVPESLEREAHRLTVERETNCRHYGDAMNQWARQKNIAEPCGN